jgi:predicted RNA methylase
VTAPATYCTLYHRDDAFAALAEAELYALGGGEVLEPGIWGSPVPIRWARCGYGRAGGRQLACATTLDELEQKVRALRLEVPRFSIRLLRIPQRRTHATEAKVLVADCIQGAVSEEAPQLRLLLIVSPSGFRLLEESFASPGEADWQRAMHKPFNYVVGLPFRIAQAMINLSIRPGDTMLDPFCGSGSLPLLASWAGHEAFGSDISHACVTRARENLAFFDRAATLVCADARVATQTADVIVTNLPYGLYSHFATDGLSAALENLARLASRATFVTSERIEPALRALGYEVAQVIPVESQRFERFVYVTRTGRARPEIAAKR